MRNRASQGHRRWMNDIRFNFLHHRLLFFKRNSLIQQTAPGYTNCMPKETEGRWGRVDDRDKTRSTYRRQRSCCSCYSTRLAMPLLFRHRDQQRRLATLQTNRRFVGWTSTKMPRTVLLEAVGCRSWLGASALQPGAELIAT